MNYNIHFCVISVLYLSMILVYYRSHRVPNAPRVRLFSALLFLSMISVVLDAASAFSDSIGSLLPLWLLYAGNILFLACLHFCAVLLFAYLMSITGYYKGMSTRRKLLLLLPYFILLFFLFISPLGKIGVFYIDETNHYQRGASHFLVFLHPVLYLIAAAFCIFYNKRRQNKRLKQVFVAFFLIILIGMAIQSRYPHIILTSMCITVGITLICFVFEAPNHHIDALTGVFNISTLPMCIKNAYNQAESFSLLVFSFQNFSFINRALGTKSCDEILIYFSSELERRFPNAQVFRTGGDEFSVLLYNCGFIDLERLEKISSELPSSIFIGEASITLHYTKACINSSSCKDTEEMLDLHSYLSRCGHRGANPGELICGEDFIEKYRRTRKMELAVKHALDEQRVEVYFQPIHDAEGQLTSAEALMRIIDDEMGMLPAQECVELAESSGDIIRLGEQVLERVCRFIAENYDIVCDFDHISVNLSALQCSRHNLADTVQQICDKYDAPSSLVSFELTETAAASIVATRQNMDRLIAQGHCFFLDDFGTGYANFEHIAYLPFSFVKIDKSILWSAANDAQSMVFLKKTVEMLSGLGIKSICEGVETAEQVRLLRGLGVTLLQGYYYSKPLPPDAFVEYIRKVRDA